MINLTEEQIKEIQERLDFEKTRKLDFPKLLDEYCEYKKIEEELGIDLITLFKALKNGVYVKTLKNNFHRSVEYKNHITLENIFWLNIDYGDGHWIDHRIDKYGKTWALTKEELL